MKTSQDTLFVVDDDPKSCEAMAALASSMKIRCETLVSAEGFLNGYNPALRGCALVDFRLGGMNGLELQDRRGHGQPPVRGADQRVRGRAPGRRPIKGGAVACIEKSYEGRRIGRRDPQARDRTARPAFPVRAR